MSDNDEELAFLPFDDGSAGRVIRRSGTKDSGGSA